MQSGPAPVPLNNSMTITKNQNRQFPLFQLHGEGYRTIATTPDIDTAITKNCAVAIGVSGGKDSAATAFRTIEYLNALGHQGTRILIHSHLGRVEWRQSLPACERLADTLRLDLVVVRRETGELLDRWRVRWANNVRRYSDLCCVKLILPWSTASMRFCTSEMKTAIIARDLVRRFPHQTILSVSGIRRQESSRRAGAPVAKVQPKLHRASFQTSGLDWHPIIDGYLAMSWSTCRLRTSPCTTRIPGTALRACPALSVCWLHEGIWQRRRFARTTTRCIVNWFASRRNRPSPFRILSGLRTWRRIYSAQRSREPLSPPKYVRESGKRPRPLVPAHLLYESGRPRVIPTPAEAELLCQIRRLVGATLGFAVSYTEPQALIQRYVDLIRLRPNRKPGRQARP